MSMAQVHHNGEVDRVVLLVNFWHPDLPNHAKRIEINNHGYEAI